MSEASLSHGEAGTAPPEASKPGLGAPDPVPEADPAAPDPAPGPGPGSEPSEESAERAAAPLARAVIWALAAVASYGLTLFVASERFPLLAIPGMLGLGVVEFVVVRAVLRRPSTRAGAPYATDGTDHRGAVKYLHKTLVKRYAVLVLAFLAVMAVPLVTRGTYHFPLMGVGLLGVLLATALWFDQLRWVWLCARVLNVYSFEFRAPVAKLDLPGGGRRFLALGVGEHWSPEMSAREPMGHRRWPEQISEGVWFAGDEVFGGALLVPGTGELMCMQPVDWDALEEWRDAAGDERRAKAKRAGLDRNSV